VLEAAPLLHRALRKAGRKQFSDMGFLRPLERLLQSYREEAELSAFGRWAVHFDISRSLNNQLRMDAAEEVNPGICNRVIRKPLFITGLPRSGSTFLHALLAEDPENKVPRCWQVIYPHSNIRDGRIAHMRKLQVSLQLQLFQLLSPGLKKMHPFASDMPQECTDITAQVFQSLRFEVIHHLPSYRAWLASKGHAEAFRFHRRFLQHLQGPSSSSYWILKSPDHVFSLDAICATYSDARFVFMHRDPVSVVSSCTKLIEALRRPFSRNVDGRAIGQYICDRLLSASEHMLRASATLNSDRILHLHYDQVASEPMAAVQAIYCHHGRELTASAENRMRRWLSQQEVKKRKQHQVGEYGIYADRIYSDFVHYIDCFGVALSNNEPGKLIFTKAPN